MALNNSPSIVTSGLLFYYDMNNPNSYFGPPLTNILPNGVNAGYPTYPSGWGTYNTNQYNNNVYFSIGTISSVVSNVVTTATNHPLRTYDVVTPQTTGGGVTAGVNYLVKKLSDTTFSLFAYNSTQDAYDIFTTAHSSIDTNTTVSINSTSFPTMWWGPPHLPNSGIMKQIVRNGFQWEGRTHDCLRIHWYRPDGVKDGMAYGNEPTVTSGQSYTVNFYHRAATPNCVGSTVSFQRWTNGDQAAVNFTLGSTWQKFTYTWVPTQSGTTYFYWFDVNTPARSSWDISEIMFYQGTGTSQYVSSNATRSNTQALLDLTKNNTITATSLTYNNDGTFSFNGTNNYATISNTNYPANWTDSFSLEVWMKVPTGATWHDQTTFGANSGTPIIGRGSYVGSHGLGRNGTDTVFFMVRTDSGLYFANSSGTARDIWYHFIGVYDTNTVKLYRNGVLIATTAVTQTGTPGTGSWAAGGNMAFGGNNGGYGAGTYPIIKIYNTALSAGEVYQNFNALRGRYGL